MPWRTRRYLHKGTRAKIPERKTCCLTTGLWRRTIPKNKLRFLPVLVQASKLLQERAEKDLSYDRLFYENSAENSVSWAGYQVYIFFAETVGWDLDNSLRFEYPSRICPADNLKVWLDKRAFQRVLWRTNGEFETNGKEII